MVTAKLEGGAPEGPIINNSPTNETRLPQANENWKKNQPVEVAGILEFFKNVLGGGPGYVVNGEAYKKFGMTKEQMDTAIKYLKDAVDGKVEWAGTDTNHYSIDDPQHSIRPELQVILSKHFKCESTTAGIRDLQTKLGLETPGVIRERTAQAVLNRLVADGIIKRN